MQPARGRTPMGRRRRARAPGKGSSHMARAFVYRKGRIARPSNAGLAAFIALLLGALAIVSVARAGDIVSARDQLEHAKENLKDGNFNSLQDSLKNAEEFLDGVPDA